MAAIRGEGREARFVRADVGKPAEAKALIDETVAVWGGVDVLYNNAGIAPIGRDGFTAAIAEDDWDWIIRVNLTSVFLCCKYAIPVMAGRPGASIVNTASSMALLPLEPTMHTRRRRPASQGSRNRWPRAARSWASA